MDTDVQGALKVLEVYGSHTMAVVTAIRSAEVGAAADNADDAVHVDMAAR